MPHRIPLLARLVAPWLAALVSACSLAGEEPPRPWTQPAFRPLTAERIATLPADERPAWDSYWQESLRRRALLPARPARDYSPAAPIPAGPKRALHPKGLRLDETAAWYASPEADALARHVVALQLASGGWTKGNDYTGGTASVEPGEVWAAGTFDNAATTLELAFLARVLSAQPAAPAAHAWRRAFDRGLDYVLAAQYPNGGFPQIYPLAGGYHDAVTFNDDAMARVLALLRAIGRGEPPFAFAAAEQRAAAAERFARGLDCVRRSQVRAASGARTGWAQQYDALTLEPCAARNFEPVALAVAETTTLLELLRAEPADAPDHAAALADGIAWLRRIALRDVEWDRSADEGSGLVPTPGAAPLWARLYEIGTDRPIFGDRDRTIHFRVTEISAERRRGYQWFGRWPADLLRKVDKAKPAPARAP